MAFRIIIHKLERRIRQKKEKKLSDYFEDVSCFCVLRMSAGAATAPRHLSRVSKDTPLAGSTMYFRTRREIKVSCYTVQDM